MATKEKTNTSTTEVMIDLNESLKSKTKYPKLKDSIFKRIGAIGFEKLTTPLTVSLTTGLPICLMGEAGTGKTFICHQIAQYLLECQYSAIDASKANWEELVGPWDLKTMVEERRMEFMKTAFSLWGKELLFIDEVTRGETRVMNGFLEVLKDNSIQGVQSDLKFKVGAANYLHHEGTTPVSEAMADRFAFVVDVPKLVDQGRENLRLIAQQGSKIDDLVVSEFVPNYKKKSSQYTSLKDEFIEYRKKVGSCYAKIREKLDIVEYCIILSTTYQGKLKEVTAGSKKSNGDPFEIEQRRFNQLVEIISWWLAVEVYEYENYISTLNDKKKAKAKFTEDEYDAFLHSEIYNCILANVNVKLSGKSFSESHLTEAHHLALKVIKSKNLEDIGYQIIKETDLTKKLYLSLFSIEQEPLAIHTAWDMLQAQYDLNEENHFGTKYNESATELENFDVILPLIPIIMPNSPFAYYTKFIPEDLMVKIKETCQFAYEYKLLEHNKDYPDEITNFLDKQKFDEEKEKSGAMSLEYTYGDKWKSLDTKGKLLRESLWRRFVADEGKFARIALGLGEIEKTDKPDKIKKEEKAIQDSYDNLVMPSYRYNVKVAVDVMDKIAASAEQLGLSHLLD